MPRRAKIITNQLIRMSSVTFTRRQMMQEMVRPLIHSREEFFSVNIKYISSLVTFTSNTPFYRLSE